MVFNPSKCHLMAVDSGPCTISHIPHFYELCGTILTSVDQAKISVSYAIPWPHLEPSHWEGCHQSQLETWFHQEKPQRQPREAEETSLYCPGQIRPGVCIGCQGPSSSQRQRPTGKMPTPRCVLEKKLLLPYYKCLPDVERPRAQHTAGEKMCKTSLHV